MRSLAWNRSLCYGCRTCQLACSFHHTGSFWPAKSSISASRTPQTGGVRWSVDATCDVCRSEELALCVKYCTYGALALKEDMGRER